MYLLLYQQKSYISLSADLFKAENTKFCGV